MGTFRKNISSLSNKKLNVIFEEIIICLELEEYSDKKFKADYLAL
jgi:hypothetical protein